MSYLDYLWWYKLEDIAENFLKYLVEELNWETNEAQEYIKTFY